ncbi:MAG TPA: DJ-1/PfpI family protein [Nonomuraea sp.]|nr:DJ-1/PfpI family protein [Nonomuraea sp.]
MRVAIPLYPRFTALDAVGPYTVLAFAPGWTVTFVAAEPGRVIDDRGMLTLAATATYADLPDPDVIIVPGGTGTFDAATDEALLDWLRRAHETTQWTTSVCSGSLLLGEAGLLGGLKATSHWSVMDLLRQYDSEPVTERVVVEGKIVTAGGVSAGIDMALTLLAQASGVKIAEAVQLAIEYDPQPPLNAGSLRTAPEGTRDLALTMIT